jgi:NADH-quinone oxidoreductase subunit I
MNLPKNVIRRYGQFKAWIQFITFYEIAVGMQSTLRHLLHYNPITIQYPHEKRLFPENYRGMLAYCDTTTVRKNVSAAIFAKPLALVE